MSSFGSFTPPSTGATVEIDELNLDTDRIVVGAGLGNQATALAKGAPDTVFGVNGSGTLGYKADATGSATALSTGTVTETTYGITSDGGADDVVLVSATASFAGLLTKAKFDEIVANTLKVSAVGSVTSHSDVTNAGSGAIITGTERTNLGTALSHLTSDGSSHTFINQSVTTTSAPSFGGLNVKGGSLFVDSGTGNVGFGISAPVVAIHVVRASGLTRLLVTNGSSSGGSLVDYVNNQAAGNIRFRVYGSAVGTTDFGVNANSLGILSCGADISNLVIGTSKASASVIFATVGAEKMRLAADGRFRIGSSSSAAGSKLHVEQESTSGAIPVLILDQRDVSEEMMEFACTVGTGNAIEAVGAKSLTTTHFIKVTITGVGTRYIPVGTIA